MSRNEKMQLKFCDYYSFMTYTDFAAWQDTDDDSGLTISYSDLISTSRR
jgi:hypothetical protein